MIGRIFHSVRNEKGLTAIKANDHVETVLIVYKSPYASPELNFWLEKRLIKLYTSYYIRTNIESLGQFWKAKEPTILVQYGE